jgi:hypothetical protein
MFRETQRTWARNPENTGDRVSRFARFRGVSTVGRLQDVCSGGPKRLQSVCTPDSPCGMRVHGYANARAAVARTNADGCVRSWSSASRATWPRWFASARTTAMVAGTFLPGSRRHCWMAPRMMSSSGSVETSDASPMKSHRFKCADKDEICANSGVCAACSPLFAAVRSARWPQSGRQGNAAAALRPVVRPKVESMQAYGGRAFESECVRH